MNANDITIFDQPYHCARRAAETGNHDAGYCRLLCAHPADGATWIAEHPETLELWHTEASVLSVATVEDMNRACLRMAGSFA